MAEISNAEWQVMRVVWSLSKASSKQIIDALVTTKDWKPATTKTLIGRLVKKGYVGTKRNGRAYEYFPLVKEQDTINQEIVESFSNICQKHVGNALSMVLEQYTLTQDDITKLQDILKEKKKGAPKTLACNCVSQDNCDCKK